MEEIGPVISEIDKKVTALETVERKLRHIVSKLFWSSRSPIWNNGGDTIFIRDSEGQLILSYIY